MNTIPIAPEGPHCDGFRVHSSHDGDGYSTDMSMLLP